MEQKSYIDIQRFKPSFMNGFHQEDDIVVQEKIDGANFSIRYDEEENVVRSYSRKRELCVGNNLRGAFEWANTLDSEAVKKALGNNLILFMEWLVPHTVQYPKERYHQAYCYDLYDTEKEEYLPQDVVKEKADELGITYVPVFYSGKFISWDHLLSMVGQTRLGGEYGEGIVVKNQSRLNDKNTRLPFYTKIVAERFRETKAHQHGKAVDPSKVAERECAQELAKTIVTEPRVVKMIHKFVDDGIIPEDWDEKNMQDIAKNIGKAIYYDCTKEEPEIVKEVGELFGKFASSISMCIVRGMLNKKRATA